MADYCAVCGRAVPPRRRGEAHDAFALRKKGWFVKRSRPLRDGLPGAEHHFVCPDCLLHPSPFAHELLRLWRASGPKKKP
jgi:hypothetical protein